MKQAAITADTGKELAAALNIATNGPCHDRDRGRWHDDDHPTTGKHKGWNKDKTITTMIVA